VSRLDREKIDLLQASRGTVNPSDSGGVVLRIDLASNAPAPKFDACFQCAALARRRIEYEFAWIRKVSNERLHKPRWLLCWVHPAFVAANLAFPKRLMPPPYSTSSYRQADALSQSLLPLALVDRQISAAYCRCDANNHRAPIHRHRRANRQRRARTHRAWFLCKTEGSSAWKLLADAA
jgi:hypothetical protein